MTAALPVVAAGFLVLDQWSKLLALRFLAGTRLPGLRLTLNGRWGFGSPPARTTLVGLWGLTAAVVLFALLEGPFAGPAARIGLTLALAGATGNLLDRVRRGVVVDFVALWRWPPFNLADTAIVLGVGVALLAVA